MVKNYAKNSNIPICPGLTNFSIYFIFTLYSFSLYYYMSITFFLKYL